MEKSAVALIGIVLIGTAVIVAGVSRGRLLFSQFFHPSKKEGETEPEPLGKLASAIMTLIGLSLIVLPRA
jgi:hypothetical protein